MGLYPLETIRTHLAEGEYKGIVDAARGIIRQEGFGGLYGVSTCPVSSRLTSVQEKVICWLSRSQGRASDCSVD